jgi:hypothetical protein
LPRHVCYTPTFMISNVNDNHIYVGTVNNHPAEWIIVRLFQPPKWKAGQAAVMAA